MLLIHEVGLREFKEKQSQMNTSADKQEPTIISEEILGNYYHEPGLIGGHHFCEIYLLTHRSYYHIGLISYWHSPDINAKRSKILDIRITNNYQGRGFGTRVINGILKESLEYGSLYLSLVVFSRNKQAHLLYHKLGFISWKKFGQSEMMISLLH